ncbi:MAG: RDD family protein [Flavobacteriaceae bacterium]|nr:RDD family protein [Flavobacteriaceae bacterium]
MEYIQINTSQNVKIKFLQASIGLRMLSFFIDTVIKMAYFFLLFWILTKIKFWSLFDDRWSLIAILSIVTSPVTFYTLFFEIIMEGQTPAKRWLQLKVIKIDGYQAKFSDYLVRWFFALVDFYFSSGVVAIISIIVSKRGQRLGGFASGTTVINLKNKVKLNHTILEEISEEYQVKFPNVLILNDEDVQIIKSQFTVASQKQNYAIIRKLAEKITEVTQSEQGTMNDMDFVKTVLKDYNYLTSKEK